MPLKNFTKISNFLENPSLFMYFKQSKKQNTDLKNHNYFFIFKTNIKPLTWTFLHKPLKGFY